MSVRFSVCFIPFQGSNPYQRELAAHLAQAGIHVNGRAWVKGLLSGVVCGRERARIIHLHWLPKVSGGASALRSLLYVLRLAALRLVGARIVWTAHNLYNHEATWRAGERWMTRMVAMLASKVIVHSETARQIVSREFAPAAHKIAVVPHGNFVQSYPNGISRAEARRRLNLAPDAVVFLFFGLIRAYKGVPELIDAYRRLRTGVPTGLIIRGNPREPQLESAIREAIAGHDRIHFETGFVADDDVQVYMNACDTVVFPYRDILTSGAVILAMSFARACIAPARGCIPDVLDDGGAFLYDPEGPDGLHGALAAAVRNRDRLEEMGAHNLDRAMTWGWDRVARETEQVYAEVLG